MLGLFQPVKAGSYHMILKVSVQLILKIEINKFGIVFISLIQELYLSAVYHYTLWLETLHMMQINQNWHLY